MKILRQYQTQSCIYTLIENQGDEYWHCGFKDKTHPVNKKAFRMSGAEHDEDYTETQ